MILVTLVEVRGNVAVQELLSSVSGKCLHKLKPPTEISNLWFIHSSSGASDSFI